MSDLEQAIEAAMPYVTTSRGVAAIRRVALVSRIEALRETPCGWCAETPCSCSCRTDATKCDRCYNLAEAEKALEDA